MGSPKELQRLQLSEPETVTENISLRSPISSRIWQAEDPTHHLGFTGEDVSMRNFCVSVHGDNELEGGFSFDTEGLLGPSRDDSVDVLSTLPVVEVQEHHSSLQQDDCKTDLKKSEHSESQSYSERSSDGSTFTASQFKEVTHSGLKTSNVAIEREKGDLSTPGHSSKSAIFDSKTSYSDNIPHEPVIAREIQHTAVDSSSDLKSTSSEKAYSNNSSVIEIRLSTTADGSPGCKKTSNDGFSTKAKCELANPSNNLSTQSDRVEYRSIAMSPIVPPGSTTNFTFHSAMESTTISSTNVLTTGKQVSNKDDLSKTTSFELTPPGQDDGINSKVQYRSIAVSPIIPPDGEASFTFQTEPRSLSVQTLQCHGTEKTTGSKSVDSVPKTYSFELTPPNADIGTETRVECKSVAVSPIIPPDGSSFTFQTLNSTSSTTSGLQTHQSGEVLSKTSSFELTPHNQDVWTQADTRAECVSVAVSPIIPPGASSSFTFHTEQKNQVMYREDSGRAEGKGHITEATNPQTQTSTAEKQNQNVGTRSRCVSVAVSPIVPPNNVSSFTFHTEQTFQPAGQTNEKNTRTYSFELTPPDEDAGKNKKVEYRSVAVSPIVPPGGSSFTFQTEQENLPKTYSFELTPPNEDTGGRVGNKVECVSVAISPIVLPQESSTFTFQSYESAPDTGTRPSESIQLKPSNHDVGVQVEISALCTSIAISPIVPLDGACSFVFQSEAISQGAPSTACSHEKPTMKDVEMQVSFSVETKSVATDPMTPIGKSPCTSYPEVRVKESKGDHPEPVREVSWDEKGMTWEVYGASMEVEVLGMAIQKHLEKQIEEHGRQKVMTPQNTRGSSVRGTTGKGETKKQPNASRSFFHCVRRPRCCSRAAPAVE
uniref:G protein-regulated inducer of neurite outgrowth C-terminal domain-containing protein n=1 Tax=Leptobrachium leishanense TaxID=445787 RepID=A0A8C5MAH6_9ANUR